MSDEQWLRILINSGLDLATLDKKMSATSKPPSCALTSPNLKSEPVRGSKAASIRKELQKLTAGTAGVVGDTAKFRRI